jgi:hypothetical protein
MLRDIEEISTTEGPKSYSRSAKKMLRSPSIERGHYYAGVFMRVLERKEKKHSFFMPCATIEWSRMSLKEFRCRP